LSVKYFHYLKGQFNFKFATLEIGYAVEPPLGLSKIMQVDTPRGKPYIEYYLDPGPFPERAKRVYSNKTMEQILREAPIGSWVTWSNFHAEKLCKKNHKLSFCSFINENTIKAGANAFVAHPFGNN
jgi:hypothetical protein